MKVFISWSGTKSKKTAELLSSWIRQVIQAAETWISLDIEKGARWNEKISMELEETKIGIICLNKENLSSEWILFEAGALSKTKDAHVCTFLLDINPAEVKPPLGQFQHTSFNKDDIKKLMHTINNKILANKEKTLPEKDLDEVFEVFWNKLESKLEELKDADYIKAEKKRTDRDILEEILQVVRANPAIDTYSMFYPTASRVNLGHLYPFDSAGYVTKFPNVVYVDENQNVLPRLVTLESTTEKKDSLKANDTPKKKKRLPKK